MFYESQRVFSRYCSLRLPGHLLLWALEMRLFGWHVLLLLTLFSRFSAPEKQASFLLYWNPKLFFAAIQLVVVLRSDRVQKKSVTALNWIIILIVWCPDSVPQLPPAGLSSWSEDRIGCACNYRAPIRFRAPLDLRTIFTMYTELRRIEFNENLCSRFFACCDFYVSINATSCQYFSHNKSECDILVRTTKICVNLQLLWLFFARHLQFLWFKFLVLVAVRRDIT